MFSGAHEFEAALALSRYADKPAYDAHGRVHKLERESGRLQPAPQLPQNIGVDAVGYARAELQRAVTALHDNVSNHHERWTAAAPDVAHTAQSLSKKLLGAEQSLAKLCPREYSAAPSGEHLRETQPAWDGRRLSEHLAAGSAPRRLRRAVIHGTWQAADALSRAIPQGRRGFNETKKLLDIAAEAKFGLSPSRRNAVITPQTKDALNKAEDALTEAIEYVQTARFHTPKNDEYGERATDELNRLYERNLASAKLALTRIGQITANRPDDFVDLQALHGVNLGQEVRGTHDFPIANMKLREAREQLGTAWLALMQADARDIPAERREKYREALRYVNKALAKIPHMVREAGGTGEAGYTVFSEHVAHPLTPLGLDGESLASASSSSSAIPETPPAIARSIFARPASARPTSEPFEYRRYAASLMSLLRAAPGYRRQFAIAASALFFRQQLAAALPVVARLAGVGLYRTAVAAAPYAGWGIRAAAAAAWRYPVPASALVILPLQYPAATLALVSMLKKSLIGAQRHVAHSMTGVPTGIVS